MIPVSTATVPVIGREQREDDPDVRAEEAGAVDLGRLLVVLRERADEAGVEEHRQRHQQADVEHDHPEVVAGQVEVAHRDVERDEPELEREDDPERRRGSRRRSRASTRRRAIV